MRWFKKFEDFKGDELEIEIPIHKKPDVAQIESPGEEKNKKNFGPYVDDEGIVYISDWNKY